MSDGKSQALSRIESILDDASFVELQALVTARSTDFGESEQAPSDGVVIGHGQIDGDLVFIYAQDPSVKNGSIGEMHAKKILSVYDMARKVGAPVIGLLDSTGIRLTESVDALEAVAAIVKKASDCKGEIPEITAVYGTCGGGLSVLASVSDFTFMTKDSRLFVNSPDTIPGNSKEKCDTASAEFQASSTGVVDDYGTEAEVAEAIRSLISVLPSSDREGGRLEEEYTDDLNRAAEGIADKRTDIAAFATEIGDSREFVETKKHFAPTMVTGFIRLGGQTVGVVGNSACKEGRFFLTADGVYKAADFVNYCDSMSIPVLSLINAEGYQKSVEAEKSLPGALAALAYAFAEAETPKVSVYLTKAVGTSFLFMDAKSLGADLVFAYSDTEIASMAPADAAKLLSKDGLDAATFEEKECGAANAARRGYVDRLLTFPDTRKYLISAFDMLATKEAF